MLVEEVSVEVAFFAHVGLSEVASDPQDHVAGGGGFGVGVGNISISVGIVAAGLGSASGEGLAPPPQPAIKTTNTSIKIQESFFINSTLFSQYFMLFSQTLLYTPTFALSNAQNQNQVFLG